MSMSAISEDGARPVSRWVQLVVGVFCMAAALLLNLAAWWHVL